MRILLRLGGLVLVVIGLTAALLTGIALIMPGAVQPDYSDALPHVAKERDLEAPRPLIPAAPAPGHPIGVVEIPRLGLSSVVIEGDETAALLLGVGHLSDTPLPWRGGNSVLAAHRDTFFRGLGGIRAKDVIRFRTADAEFEYRVKDTQVVEPTDVQVLAPTKSATLTLITCYPFTYIGPAPQRFIVRAERISNESGGPRRASTGRAMRQATAGS